MTAVSPYFTMGHPFPTKIAPFHGGSGPPSNTRMMVPWAHLSPQPKQYLDRFSRFAGLTSVTDRQTDKQTTLLGR